MSHRPNQKKSAFSLVELSIVLVILGLLVGGILAGQSLIRAAELRAISTEQARFTTAISAFRDKYFAIPGDFSTTGFGTTGWIGFGDGDGLVEAVASSVTPINEISAFWIHLSNAGLIEGSFTITAQTSTSLVAGTNKPRSKLSAAGWNVFNLGTVTSTANPMFASNYGNAFIFGGGTTPGSSAAVATGVIKAEEAWNIDTKMDDARPDQGTVLTYSGVTNCVTGTAYDLASTAASACALIFKTGY